LKVFLIHKRSRVAVCFLSQFCNRHFRKRRVNTFNTVLAFLNNLNGTSNGSVLWIESMNSFCGMWRCDDVMECERTTGGL
jgi:hypothetical protein